MFECWNNLGSVPALIGPPLQQGKGGQPIGRVQMWPGPDGVYDTNDGARYPIDPGPVNPLDTPVVPAPVVGPAHRGQSLAACQAYVVKYRRVYGRDPVGIWCLGMPTGGQTDIPPPAPAKPPRDIHPLPPIRVNPPIIQPAPQPPLATSPVYHKRRRPPRIQPRPQPRQSPVAGPPSSSELCPARGWVSRAIPGVNEYRTVACTPGQAVVIDQGLATVVRQGALARAGLSGLSDLDDTQATFAGLFHEFLIGNVSIPSWLPVLALTVGAAFLWRTTKRR